MSLSDEQDELIAGSRDVTLVGRRRSSLAAIVSEEPNLTAVERTIGFSCTSGRRISATWIGFPPLSVLEHVGIPEETTHLVIEGSDGHQGCVSLPEAMDGLLAVERDGEPLEAPRFVAPTVDGPRTVSQVRRLSAIHLEPGEEREVHEYFLLDEETLDGRESEP